MAEDSRKLGFGALVGIVFGMMVGSGLYNIPQNMAMEAGPLGSAIGWVVTAVGMLLLVGTLKILSDRRPDLNAGVYQYAREGFGNYAGFNIAWGYWLCTAFANVAYAVMLNDSFGAFLPPLLDHGWPTLLFGTVLIWSMFFIVSAGIRTAKILNSVMAVVKVLAIALVVVLLFLNVNVGTFSLNLSDLSDSSASLWEQVKGTMLVTLWCFIGIEGAVMVSARARRSEDVGRATVTGFLVAWLLYVLVSMLCFGVMSRARLMGLEDPSVAYVMREICGEWAYWFVIAAVIISLLGGWVAWTIVCAEVPYEAAVVGIFPRSFLRLNRHGMPAYGLFVSSMAMQIFLLLVMMADDVYMAALQITGMMVLPAYLAGGMFLVKISMSAQDMRQDRRSKRRHYRVVGVLCSLFCLWMIYAGGLQLFISTSIFYIAGTGFYLKARRDRKAALRKAGSRAGLPFTRADRITLLLLIAGLALTLLLL